LLPTAKLEEQKAAEQAQLANLAKLDAGGMDESVAVHDSAGVAEPEPMGETETGEAIYLNEDPNSWAYLPELKRMWQAGEGELVPTRLTLHENDVHSTDRGGQKLRSWCHPAAFLLRAPERASGSAYRCLEASPCFLRLLLGSQ
jgi:hypothetical protein